jgi:GTP cyclohydrolase N terminal
VQQVFSSQLKQGLDVRPTIAITKAHMQLAEIEAMVQSGSIPIDGQVVLNKQGQLMVTKGAGILPFKLVEPVWHLPGMAKRFGVDESTLRRAYRVMLP